MRRPQLVFISKQIKQPWQAWRIRRQQQWEAHAAQSPQWSDPNTEEPESPDNSQAYTEAVWGILGEHEEGDY